MKPRERSSAAAASFKVLLDLRAVTPEGSCQPRGIRGGYALGEQSIAALDLGAVGAGSAGQRDIQQKQVVDGAIQQALLKKPRLVVQVGQGSAQQGEQPARSPGCGPMQSRVQRQMMEVALKGPHMNLGLLGQTVHGVAVGGGQKRLADVQQAQLHAGGPGLDQVPDQLGLRMAVARAQGDHLERAASTGGHDLLGDLAERQTAPQGRAEERMLTKRQVGRGAAGVQVGAGLLEIAAGPVEESRQVGDQAERIVARGEQAVERAE